jgi:hypothetical protein
VAMADGAGWAADKSGGKKGKAKQDEYQSTFKVDKANLGSTGENPYFFSLVPGTRLVLKGGGATLTVTVLNETKTVDGVETRIIEEREEKDGKLVEISRNYFAIDKKTKDVYYFGEDVDMYKDGKVDNHEGSWLSGAGGASFGMMMPAKPKVGVKFQQEVAPKVAMDRCEIIAVGEECKTAAGTFKDCVRVKDSSALEAGSGEKIYAAGVGLVKDDEFELVKIEKAAQDTGKSQTAAAKAPIEESAQKSDKTTVSADDVPATVKKAFQVKFPTVKETEWKIKSDKTYEAEFTLNGAEVTVMFDAAGKWLETESAIDPAKVPKVVSDAAAKAFAGYKVIETQSVERWDAKHLIYELHFEKANEIAKAQFSEEGKILNRSAKAKP